MLSPEWSAISSLLSVNKGCALDIGAGRGIASYALAKEAIALLLSSQIQVPLLVQLQSVN